MRKTYNTGAVNPTVVVSQPPSVYPWEDLDHVYSSFPDFGEESDILTGKGFGFSVPSDATILGVVARIHFAGFPQTDVRVQLRDATGAIGTPKARTFAEGFPGWVSFGSATDLWGAVLVPATINNSDFAIDFKGTNESYFGGAFFIDKMELTIYYKSRHKP